MSKMKNKCIEVVKRWRAGEAMSQEELKIAEFVFEHEQQHVRHKGNKACDLPINQQLQESEDETQDSA